MIALLAPLLAAPVALPAAESAPRRLSELVERYATLDPYYDRGQIVRRVLEGGVVLREERFNFETVRRGDDFLLRLIASASGRLLVVGRRPSGSFHYDGARGELRPVPTPSSGLPQLLAWGDGLFDALLVPLLLAEPGATQLATAGDAVVTGTVPCGGRDCDELRWTAFGGHVETTIAIARSDGLVRRVSTRRRPPVELLVQALADAGLASPRARAGASPTEVNIETTIETLSFTPSATSTSFTPPANTIQVESFSTAASDARSLEVAADADVVYRDQVLVREMTTAVRVVDAKGEPLRDLMPADFTARVGKVELPVRAAVWVSAQEPYGHDLPPEVRSLYDIAVPAPGKLVVLFVQADLNPVRAKGHLRLLPEADRLLATLDLDDWVAVVSFDSHLKLRQDFTRSHELVREAVRKAIRSGAPPPLDPGRFPSLARHFDERAAKRAATPEEGLLRMAEALAELPGEKTVVYIGWGLGRYGAGGVRMTPDYDPARAALARANATVFVLDITQADYHSLEIGLQQVARDTGGTYDRTFHFPGNAVNRLAATIEGHYLLTLELPADLDDGRALKIVLRERKGRVLYPPTYVGGRR